MRNFSQRNFSQMINLAVSVKKCRREVLVPVSFFPDIKQMPVKERVIEISVYTSSGIHEAGR